MAPAAPSAPAHRRIAIVDGASFALPYVQGLASGLARRGFSVCVFASLTRYNAEFLDALRSTPGTRVVDAKVSGTVAPRWRGVLAYAGLWWRLWRERRAFSAVNLQFSVLWPLELPFLALLRRRFVFTVHNAVPHGFEGRQHAPTRWFAGLARRLVFVSPATRDDFLQRYGPAHAAKAHLLQHGLLPLAPGLPVQPYAAFRPPRALVFWSTVKPYKGVELFRELARSPAWAAQGLALEVHGAWAPEMHALRDELRALGVTIVDRFLDSAALRDLLSRDVLFILPHHRASQSGALYTLLHHGCLFLCTDTGDLGDFLRHRGLPQLLLQERSAEAVIAALAALRADPPRVLQALGRAQQQLQWDAVLATADESYAT